MTNQEEVYEPFEDAPQPEEVEQLLLNEKLEEALSYRKPQEKDIFCMYYGKLGREQKTQGEIALHFDLDQSSVARVVDFVTARTVQIMKQKYHFDA